MSKVRGIPSHQAFCVAPRKNLTKHHSWWQSSQQHNNSVKKNK